MIKQKQLEKLSFFTDENLKPLFIKSICEFGNLDDLLQVSKDGYEITEELLPESVKNQNKQIFTFLMNRYTSFSDKIQSDSLLSCAEKKIFLHLLY